jgi:hypothetical protein
MVVSAVCSCISFLHRGNRRAQNDRNIGFGRYLTQTAHLPLVRANSWTNEPFRGIGPAHSGGEFFADPQDVCYEALRAADLPPHPRVLAQTAEPSTSTFA